MFIKIFFFKIIFKFVIFNFFNYICVLCVQNYLYYLIFIFFYLILLLKKKIFFFLNVDHVLIFLNTTFLNNIFFIHTFGILIFFIKLYILLGKQKNYKFLLLYLYIFALGSFWSQQELIWGGWWNWDFLEIYFLSWICAYIYTTHIYKNNFLYFKLYQLIYAIIYFSFLKLNFWWSIHNFITYLFAKKLILFIFCIIIFNNIISLLIFGFLFNTTFYLNFRALKFLAFLYLRAMFYFNYLLILHQYILVCLIIIISFNFWNQYVTFFKYVFKGPILFIYYTEFLLSVDFVCFNFCNILKIFILNKCIISYGSWFLYSPCLLYFYKMIVLLCYIVKKKS